MPRKKKSRKVGSIGVSKSSDFTRKEKNVKKPSKGRPAGNRQAVAQSTTRSNGNSKNTDPRHGSKKLIPLQVTHAKKVVYAKPSDELAAIEADSRLIALLDKQEKGQRLRVDQKDYIESKLSRHAILCEMLGIDVSEDEDNVDIDPLDKLDAISMSDFDDESK